MSVTAIVLSYKREENLQSIIASLLPQVRSVGGGMILVNNEVSEPPYYRLAGLGEVNLSWNMGCPIRHAIGLLAETDYCLFVDDDVLPGPKLVENFLYWGQAYPESILGYYGRMVSKDGGYGKHTLVHASGVTQLTPIDIVVGKIHFCRTEKLALPWNHMEKLRRFHHFSCDDIALSLANKLAGHENYIIPWKEGGEYTSLPEHGVGLGHEEGWWDRRDEAVREMLWRRE